MTRASALWLASALLLLALIVPLASCVRGSAADGPAAPPRLARGTDGGRGPGGDRRGPGPRALSGRLQDLYGDLRMMGVESRSYTAPSEAERAVARRAFTALVSGYLPLAEDLFAEVGFTLNTLHDRGRTYYVVREHLGEPVRGWGFYVVAREGGRPYLIEAPHPRNDAGTGAIALRLMIELRAAALMVSTSYRCATSERSGCTGGTVACGEKRRYERYRLSDMAHSVRSIFHVAHEALFNALPGVIGIQIHGFDRRPGRRYHFVASDGTRLPGGRRNLANRMMHLLRKFAGRRRSIVSCNGWRRNRPLCGTQNVQGRHANGSRNPCRRYARRSRNRFLHLELSADARTKGGLMAPTVLDLALAELIPEVAAPYPLPGHAALPRCRSESVMRRGAATW